MATDVHAESVIEANRSLLLSWRKTVSIQLGPARLGWMTSRWQIWMGYSGVRTVPQVSRILPVDTAWPWRPVHLVLPGMRRRSAPK